MGLAGPGPFMTSAGAFSQLRKLRRPSLLGLGGKSGPMMSAPVSAPQSPLANSSFGPILSSDEVRLRTRGRSKSVVRPKARSNHSGSGTPPQMALDSRPRSPSTPPSTRPVAPHRRTQSTGTPQFKLPRLLSIQSELTNPADAELKSEASFQRLIASNADLPAALVRTPRPRRRDRGRFPEVYLDDDDAVESDDDDDDLLGSQPAASGSNEGLASRGALSLGGDEFTMDDVLDSPARMDIDMGSYGSPPVLSSLFSMKGWRQTPPPTVAPSRIGKRKLDERYEPYPQKRARGTSPTAFNTPNPYLLPPGTVPRSPITTAAPRPTALAPSPPIAIPQSRTMCHTPTPTYSANSGYAPMMLYGSPIPSSPAFGAMNSPILRPVRGALGLGLGGGSGSREERERERQVDGAGNGVRSLDLGG